MIEDVAVGAIEALAGGISPAEMPRRYRKRCWWLFSLTAVAVIVVVMIELNA